MMRLLFVPYVLPPLHYAAALRNLKHLIGLASTGLDIEVCHVAPDKYRHFGPPSLDQAMAEKLPRNVTYLPVDSPECNFFYRMMYGKCSGLLYFLTEPVKREWTGAAKSLLARRGPKRYDAVVTMAQPHCNHLVGLWLKNTYGVPWISYFSDPWVDNPYSHIQHNPLLRWHHTRLESKVVAGSDSLLFTSEETRQLVMSKYPDIPVEKSGLLPHSYVREWYPQQGKEEEQGLVTMLHTGHFYGPRSPRPVIDALSEVERLQGLASRFRLKMVGNMKAEDREYASMKGVGHLIEFLPTVSYLDSLALQMQADWLLTVDARSNDGPSVFLPSKLIDYLGSNKPILGVTPIPGTSARVLSEAGHPVRDLDDRAGLIDVFTQIANGWTPERSDAPMKYEVHAIGRTFLHHVEQAIDRARGVASGRGASN